MFGKILCHCSEIGTAPRQSKSLYNTHTFAVQRACVYKTAPTPSGRCEKGQGQAMHWCPLIKEIRWLGTKLGRLQRHGRLTVCKVRAVDIKMRWVLYRGVLVRFLILCPCGDTEDLWFLSSIPPFPRAERYVSLPGELLCSSRFEIFTASCLNAWTMLLRISYGMIIVNDTGFRLCSH